MSGNKSKSFKIEFSGGDAVKQRIRGKINSIRETYLRHGQKLTTSDIVDKALSELCNMQPSHEINNINTYLSAQRNETRDETLDVLYLTSVSSLCNLMDITEKHARQCSGKLLLEETKHAGHVLIATLTCNKPRNQHKWTFSTSPYMPDGKFLANKRMVHGYLTSGMLPSHFERFCMAANIGKVGRHETKMIQDQVVTQAAVESKESTNQALLEEVASYEKPEYGIDIETDARFAWRKNSRDSSVVCLGEKTKKVLVCETVTKADEPVSQRHETYGTKKIYDQIEQNEVAPSFVNIHTHDSNGAINTIATERASINQNETWHGIKSLKKSLKNICSGALKWKGKKWHPQLADKADSVCTHVRWALRNCEENAEKLRSSIMNCVEHLKGNHANCFQNARCRSDPNYEPSKIIITSPVAENLLKDVLPGSTIYKKAENFRLCRDTYCVESFNNTMNIFQDKRIAFSTDMYKFKSDLAVAHWNENVNRPVTSYYRPKGAENNPLRPGKKVRVDCSFNYVKSMWDRHMKALYQAAP